MISYDEITKMRKVIIHIHIPKCGGTTIKDILSKNFGSSFGDTNSILNNYRYDRDQVAIIIDQNPHLKCLSGHKLTLDLPFEREDFDLHAITWVRDPVERFISHYFFHRHHRNNYVPETKKMDLLEYTDWALKQKNQKWYINGQTKFLSGGSIETIKSLVDAGKLTLFPLSKLQESLYALAHRFPESFVNVRTKNKNMSIKDQEIPKNFRELVLPYVGVDMQLLALAKKTKLEDGIPNHEGKVLVSGHKVLNNVAGKSARVLHRAANFIDKWDL